jgi:hypothetical protein
MLVSSDAGAAEIQNPKLAAMKIPAQRPVREFPGRAKSSSDAGEEISLPFGAGGAPKFHWSFVA